MRTNDQTASKILDIVTDNYADSDYTQETMVAALGELPPEDQQFLNELEEDDLHNVVCGNSKLSPEGSPLWLVRGEWVALPTKVESFLQTVFPDEA